MKTLTAMILTLGLALGMVPAKEVEKVTITVTVDGLRNEDGYVMVALHNGETEFPGDDAFMTKSIAVEKGSVEIVFEEVPVGEYAIAVMHDENSNEELDFNSYGMPLEGYGFSNEAQGEMGPPDFDDAAFEVTEDSDQYVEIMYLGGY
ncbi:DUF2141 domain-containing protein [Roseivirga misakiensis]|uniref:DUF2141 domain-containing protein n=1 Tax=Roseivirga misakiensis TaxID=1563681 RepID=A0A1E5T6C8_9BACT|nr:DUF2141 domain-containing protein [Roseivirga misakiensis]OEK06935.1 hypothetical protein BFP71_04575 [Roseivirga misakiensis]